MRLKRIGVIVVAGLLLLIPILPQLALAAGPEIRDVDVENITFATATITWTTNTTSDSEVNYGTDRPKDGTWKSVHETAGVTHHSILLQNLTPDTTYYFEVESGTATDDNGGEYYSFKTLAWYSISLNPIAGSCGEEITVTATVATPGTYHVCWDSLTAWDSTKATGVVDTFKATGAGSRTLNFYMPEATKGIHKVYLADNAYAKKAEANFEISPSAKIDPDEGPVGTAVTISGCGFTASEDIKVTLFEDEEQKGEEKTDTADVKGTWGPISYTIPDTPAGNYDFVVEVEESAGVWVGWVTKYFRVTPQITASSSSGTVGHTIEIKGTGFASEEEDIKVTFMRQSTDIEVVVKENIPADENGSWTAVIVVPPLQSGAYTISASGELTRARDVTGIKRFIVGAGILVKPGSAYVGDMITVEGGGFATGETGIEITFAGTVVQSGITAKVDGTWESSFILLDSTYGSNTVEASGDLTQPVVTSLNTLARIIEIGPDHGAPGDLVSLTGDGFGSSKQLTVRIGGIDASDPMQTLPNGNVAISFHVPKDSIEGKQILVVADDSGATDQVDFTVTEKTLATTPLPISPMGSTLRSGEVTFRWQGVTGGTGYTYTLEISQTAGSAAFWSKPGIGESSYTLTDTETATETLQAGTYYWRVKIVDNYGNASVWSDSIEFRVSPIPTWVWVVVGVVVLVVLMVVAYRETKFKVTE